MSTAVWEHSSANGNDLLVMLCLADHASAETYLTYPGIERLATLTRIHARTVQRVLKRLCDAGELAVYREGGRVKGQNRPTVYRILVGKKQGWQSATPNDETGVASEQLGVASDAVRGGIAMPPEPRTNQLQPTTKEDAPAALVVHGRSISGKLGGKTVTDAESEFAVAMLDVWNELTGQSLVSRDWLAKIVMRHREHPNLTVDELGAVVASALADPWWQGAPSPAVVFGNGAVFETSLMRSRSDGRGGKQASRFGRGMTTRQILDATGGKE